MSYDMLIRDASVVDGTGAWPGRVIRNSLYTQRHEREAMKNAAAAA